MPSAGTKEARFFSLETVDDFLAFDAARRFALTAEVPPELARYFELEFAPDSPPHDSEWLRCSNFVVKRHVAVGVRPKHAE